MLRAACVGLLLALLAGCSGPPAESDVQTALETRIRQDIQKAEAQARAIGGEASVELMRSFGSPKPEDLHIRNVEILESEELDNGDYEVRIRFDTDFGERSNTSTTKLIMQDTDDGWRATLPS